MAEQLKVRGSLKLVVHPDDGSFQDSLDAVHRALDHTDFLRMAHSFPDYAAQAGIDDSGRAAGLCHKQIFLHIQSTSFAKISGVISGFIVT